MLFLSLQKHDILGDERRPIVQSITKERFITNSLGGERRPIDKSATKERSKTTNRWKALSLHSILGGERRLIDQSVTKERSKTNSWNALSLYRILGEMRLIDQSTTKERSRTTVTSWNALSQRGILGGERRLLDQSATKERSRTNKMKCSFPKSHSDERRLIDQSATKVRSRTTNSWNDLSLHGILGGERLLIDQSATKVMSRCSLLTWLPRKRETKNRSTNRQGWREDPLLSSMMLLSLNGVPGSVRRVERHLILQALYQNSLLQNARVKQLYHESFQELIF